MGNTGSSDQSNDRIRELEGQLSWGRNELEKLKSEIFNLQKQLSSTQNELASTWAALNTSNQKVQKLTKDYLDLKGQLSSTRNELASTRGNLEISNQKVEKLSKDNLGLEGQLSSTRNELATTRVGLESSSQKIERLTKDNLVLEGKLSSTRNELESNRDNLEISREKIENLTRDNLDLENMINKLLKIGKLQEQLSSVKIEALISWCNLEASRKMEQELKERFLNLQKFEEDAYMKLCKVMEFEKQVSIVNAEVLSTKDYLKASKGEEDMHIKLLLNEEKNLEEMEMKFNKVMKLERELANTKNKVLTKKDEFETWKKEENLLKEQLQNCDNFHQDINTKLRMVLDHEKQISLIKAENLLIEASLDGSRKQEERLKIHLFEFKRFQQDIGTQLQNFIDLKNDISSSQAGIHHG